MLYNIFILTPHGPVFSLMVRSSGDISIIVNIKSARVILAQVSNDRDNCLGTRCGPSNSISASIHFVGEVS